MLYADGSLNGWEDDERVQQLIGIITEHAAYPFLYLVVGRTIAKVIQYFNEESKKIVEARGSLFVDIFDIPNENNMDPHPQATGHRFIADRLGDAMLPKVNVAITSGSGSVSSPARVLLGHDVTFEVEGVDGSELLSVTVNGNELDVAPDAATFTVSDVQEDLDVQVVFTGQKEEPDTPERPSVWENLMNKLPVLQVISKVIRKAFSLRDILERTAAGTRVKPAFFNQFLNH